MAINIRSAIKSGLISGLIINLSAITMVPVVGNEMDAVLSALGLPALSIMAMVFFSMISFIFGISLVFLYALVKEHLGAGIKTAIIATGIFWFITYFISNVSLVVYGFMPVRLTVIGTAWGLGELLLAGIVGFRLYKEANLKQ